MLMYGLPHGVVTAKTGCPATRSNASRSVRAPKSPERLIALRTAARGDGRGGGSNDDDDDEVVREELESVPLRAALLLAGDPAAAAACAAEADASIGSTTRTAKNGRRRESRQQRAPLPRERRSALMLSSLGVLGGADKTASASSQGSGVTLRYRWYVAVLKARRGGQPRRTVTQSLASCMVVDDAGNDAAQVPCGTGLWRGVSCSIL
jgi:hypothetical protein